MVGRKKLWNATQCSSWYIIEIVRVLQGEDLGGNLRPVPPKPTRKEILCTSHENPTQLGLESDLVADPITKIV
jgi:hypothetical protein